MINQISSRTTIRQSDNQTSTGSVKSNFSKCLGALLLLCSGSNAYAEQALKIATFDSGFGGYFTAKSLAHVASDIARTKDVSFNIHHFGDTANAPYGSKTAEQIADLTTRGVSRLLSQGADKVFIACNTASTQYTAVRAAIAKAYPGRENDVISIIDASVAEVKSKLDERLKTQDHVNFAILSTPATLKTAAYPNALAQAYNGTLSHDKTVSDGDSISRTSTINLPDKKHITLYQSAPADWVPLIENGGNIKQKETAVTQGMQRLYAQMPADEKIDGVGEFCTHYPVFDNNIQLSVAQHKRGNNPFYVKQGDVMAKWFEQSMHSTLPNRKKPLKESPAVDTPDITLSGNNKAVTEQLVRAVFPQDQTPAVSALNEQPVYSSNTPTQASSSR